MYIHRGLKRHEVEISSGVEMTSVGDFSTMSPQLVRSGVLRTYVRQELKCHELEI